MISGKTILIVDDAETNRKILKRILRSEGYATVEAENGQIALEMIDGNDSISLVLLDLTMPVMDGYELLARMKESGKLVSIPVIITTGSSDDGTEINTLELGASDFITKPYNQELVKHRVKSMLRLVDNASLINRLEIDRLTGLYTREAFYRHAEMMIESSPEQNYDIVCSNIENFKIINAKYGTAKGDELLQYIANHNRNCIGDNGICGRIGADCFVALRKSSRLRTQEEIAGLYNRSFSDAPVKNFVMQYGVYQVTDKTEPISAMCDRAQIALSSIRHKYGVYYAVYDASMRQKIFREHQLVDCMERALAEKQFVVYLQPKHEVESGAVAGAEALVRWNHPELGFISPGEFIPLFERNGFISKLDRYIWEEVCVILKKWIADGLRTIPVSVNASRVDFDYMNLPEVISDLVDSYGIPHDLIHFEVTESAYTDNPKKLINAVSILRSMGFLIEMDDFGSGYSSLNMLSELPIDILKLDMRFVQKGSELLPDSKRSILSFIVSLSKWLKLPTIAEGVETKDEVDLLKAMGCNYIQGYYYAKPMPVGSFETYMCEYERTHPVKPHKQLSACGQSATHINGKGKPCILIADDIEGNCEIIADMLGDDYNTVAVSDGKQAYEYITEHHDTISCVLLDLMMPVMDGFQLIDLMRKEGYLDDIPVIITSEAGPESELRALHLGADSYVAKPYNQELLLHHVKTAVNEREFRRLCKNLN